MINDGAGRMWKEYSEKNRVIPLKEQLLHELDLNTRLPKYESEVPPDLHRCSLLWPVNWLETKPYLLNPYELATVTLHSCFIIILIND